MQTINKVYLLPALMVLSGALIYFGLMPVPMALFVPTFATALLLFQYFLQKDISPGFIVCWLAAVVLGIVIGVYRPAGFNYPLVFHADSLYSGGAPIDLFLNVGKAVAGYTILLFLGFSFPSSRFMGSNTIYVRSYATQFLLVIVLAIIVLIIATVVLRLDVHIKDFRYILMFGVVNLLVTCVSEEAFMRLLLQAQLREFTARFMRRSFLQELVPIILVTLVFVLTHAVHGTEAIFVYAIAGFVYALTYALTKNVFAAIAVHFLVNILHFAFLSYPL